MNMIDKEVDLVRVLQRIKGNFWWILIVSISAALLTYFLSKSQAYSYSSNATILSSGTQNSPNPAGLGDANFVAQALPEGAIQQAIQSSSIILPLIRKINTSDQISEEERVELTRKLENELNTRELKTIKISSRLDPYSGGGIHTITTKAQTPLTSRILTNLTVETILEWDKGRASANLRKAESGYRSQLEQIDQQLISTDSKNSVEYQTLVARRSSLQASLTNAIILADSANGTLGLLSEANTPISPSSPKPLLNAAVLFFLTGLISIIIISVRSSIDKSVRTEDDLLEIELPTLAIIPRLRKRDILFMGIVKAGRQTGLYEAMGFLRVNLTTAMSSVKNPVIMITSTAPGEGKSSVVATLADGFAASGKRVLVIDADLRRGTQDTVWRKFGEDQADTWHSIIGSGGARTTIDALKDPDNVQAMRVENNVDVIPSGAGIYDSLSAFNQADIKYALSKWKINYDMVIIDSAPILAIADGLVIGEHVDGVIMIAESGKTSLKSMRNAVTRLASANVKIIGAVINKSDNDKENDYGYSYVK